MTEPRPWQPSLPGLTLPTGEVSAMEHAAELTLAALDRAGVLTDDHALTCQLVLELARAVGKGAASGRASAVAMAAKELREVIATLPARPAGPGDAFAQLVQELQNA